MQDWRMADGGSIAMEWQRVDREPPYFSYSTRCDPGMSLEDMTALFEQMAKDHRALLDGRGNTDPPH